MSTLDVLMGEAEEALQLRKQAEQRDLAAKVAACRALVEEALGEVWGELKPFAEEVVCAENGRVNVAYKVEAEGLALDTFWVLCNRGSVCLSNWINAGPTVKPEAMGEFLLAKRRDFMKAKAEKTKKEVERLYRKFDLFRTGCDLQEAEVVRNQLVMLAPEEKEKWERTFAAWRERFEVWQAKQQKAEEAEARKKELRGEFKAAWKEYMEARNQVIEANRATAVRIQAELDQAKMNVWDLEYAARVENEEGEQFIERQTVVVCDDEPVVGYWRVVEWGVVRSVRYMNPISLTGPYTVKASQRIGSTYATFHLDEADRDLYVLPNTDLLQVLGKYALEKLPDEPKAPECLGRAELDEVKSEVYWDMVGVQRDELPF